MTQPPAGAMESDGGTLRILFTTPYFPSLIRTRPQNTLLFERAGRLGPSRRSRLMASHDLKRTRRHKSRLLESLPRVLFASEQDKQAPVRLSTGMDADRRFVVLTDGVALEYFAPWDRPRDAAPPIFTGKTSYHANVAAGMDLVTQIMPRAWAR